MHIPSQLDLWLPSSPVMNDLTRGTAKWESIYYPDQEEDDAGAPEVQGPDLDIKFQELAHPRTGGEAKDGPDMSEENLSSLRPFQMPESGPDPETVFQQMAQPKNGEEGRDGSEVKVKILPKLEPIYMLWSRGRATRVLKEDKLKPWRLHLCGVFDY